MRKLIARRLTYANVISTLALFLALGGGAWAVGKTLVASSGAVFGCVRARGGVLRVVKENAHCRRGQVLITADIVPVCRWAWIALEIGTWGGHRGAGADCGTA